MSILVLGSINIDLTTRVRRLPRPGETLSGHSFQTLPGGKGANQAVAAAKMGCVVKMLGRVGGEGDPAGREGDPAGREGDPASCADAFGAQAIAALKGYGVDTDGILTDPNHSTGVAIINVEDSGQNNIVIIAGANGALDASDVARAVAALDGCRVLMLQMETPLDVSLALAKEAKQRGITVIFDPAPAAALPDGAYPLIDIITPNETETEILVGFRPDTFDDAARAAQILYERGANNVIIKMGALGAWLHTPTLQRAIPPFTVTVRDTVAAGDAFNGAFAASLCEGKNVEASVLWAAAAGALATTQSGAMSAMPSKQAVEKMVGQC